VNSKGVRDRRYLRKPPPDSSNALLAQCIASLACA